MVFNAYEVFEFAEQIERNGQAFYRKAAESVSSEPAKELFTKLANMEVLHEKYFAQLKEKFTEKAPDDVPDFDEQYEKYLNSLAEDKVFKKADVNEITDCTTLEEILDRAIGFERLTIVYFVSVKELVPKSFGKDKIDLIIQEEVKHISVLTGFLSALSK